jgi:hypothetical protein
MGVVVSSVGLAAVAQSAPPASAQYADQGVFGYGDAAYHGAPTNTVVTSPVVGMASPASGQGYWLAEANGGVFSYNVPFYGSARAANYKAPIVGMAATPDGGGYWLVALNGGVFSYGDAHFYGSEAAFGMQPIVGIASTPDGKGYWLVAENGGVFTYGDAGFYGSARTFHPPQPIVGIAPTADGKGYWEADANGGVYSFGDAHFYSSEAPNMATGLVPGWITGIIATADSKGYWLANSDGAVYTFGDAVNYGNDLHVPGTQPISTIARGSGGKGYWLLEPDAFPTNFAQPGGGGTIVADANTQVHADPYTGYFCNPYGPCEAWCSLFATWVWETAGIPIPRYAFVGYVFDWAATHTGVLSPGAVPAPGDFVLFGTGPQNVDTAVHMGVVAQVWPDGAIDTIEGDAGPAPTGYLNVWINGPFLPSDSSNYNGFPIFAYAVP